MHTPVLTSALLNEQLGRTVWVRAENQQLTGSFKVRGAYNALVLLDAEARRRGVVGASSGNHTTALAQAGGRLEVPVTVVVPEDLPRVKRQSIEALGARIVPYRRLSGRHDALVHQIAARSRSDDRAVRERRRVQIFWGCLVVVIRRGSGGGWSYRLLPSPGSSPP